MSEDIAMCVEGSSCYTWRAEWCEQEVTRGLAVCGGFVNRSRGPALQLIRDFISQHNKRFPFRPLLSCPGGLCLRVTPTADDGADYLIFFDEHRKKQELFLILSKRRRGMRREGGYCLNVVFFFIASQWLCVLCANEQFRGEEPRTLKTGLWVGHCSLTSNEIPAPPISLHFSEWAIWGVLALFQSFLWAQVKHILTIPWLRARRQSTIVCLPQLSLILNLPLLHHAASLLPAIFATVFVVSRLLGVSELLPGDPAWVAGRESPPALWEPFHALFNHWYTHSELMRMCIHWAGGLIEQRRSTARLSGCPASVGGVCVYKRGWLQHAHTRTHTYTHSRRLCAFVGIAEWKPLVPAAGHYCSCERKTQIWSGGIRLPYLVHGCGVWPSSGMRASCFRMKGSEEMRSQILSFFKWQLYGIVLW